MDERQLINRLLFVGAIILLAFAAYWLTQATNSGAL